MRAAKANTFQHEKPVQVKLAVSGSRANVNRYTRLTFKMHGREFTWDFNVVPLKGKDAIVGMDFMRHEEAVLVCEPPQLFFGGVTRHI